MQISNFWRRVLRLAGLAAAGAAAVWLLGPVLLPFALGLGLARAAEPAVWLLQKRCRLPRWLAAGLCVSGAYVLLLGAGWLLCRILCREVWDFLRSVPELAGSLAGPARELEQRLLRMAARFPDGLGAALTAGVEEFFRSGAGLGQRIYDWLFDFASGLLAKLPDLALFLLTAVLSSFMLSAKLPQLRSLWQSLEGRSWHGRLQALGKTLKRTVGAWLLAQSKLMLVTALLLTAGFLILRVDYALLFGLGIAFLDALPVLGTGIILIPWSLTQFARGDSFLGTGLLLLYGAAALTRTALEPRLLGRQMGLDPLLTLLALYAGYRLVGVAGMILFPIGALAAKQFWERGKKNAE